MVNSAAFTLLGMIVICMMRYAYLWLKWCLRGHFEQGAPQIGPLAALQEIAMRDLYPGLGADDPGTDDEDDNVQPIPAAELPVAVVKL